MTFDKWTAMSSENFSMIKLFQKLAQYFTRRRSSSSKPTGQRTAKAMESVFTNPMLLKKILKSLEGRTLLKFRRVSKMWLTFCDEILEEHLNRHNLEISFQYSNRHQLYFLAGHEVSWWHSKMGNHLNHHPQLRQLEKKKDKEGEEKTLENFSKLLKSSSSSSMKNYDKFPFFAGLRFVGGKLGNKIPQNFFTQHGPRIHSLTLDLVNCCSWSNHQHNYEESAQLLKIVGQLLQKQLTTLQTLYLQSFPSVWTNNNAYFGTLFPNSFSKNGKVVLPTLKNIQIGPTLIFANAKAFGLILEVAEAAVNLRSIIFRTWSYTKGGSFHTLDFMRKCIAFSTSPGGQRRCDLVFGASYFCLDPFMIRADILEQFAECCNFKISLLYLCEANVAQLSEMSRRTQEALTKIMVRNKHWLRELICTRSEFIALTQLNLPKFSCLSFISVGVGKFERRVVIDQNRDMVTQNWTQVFDIFPCLSNLHIQLNTIELLGYWSSGSVSCKLRSHQNIPWKGIVYTKAGGRSKFIHNGN